MSSYEKGAYKICPNCGNTKSGSRIRKCLKCDTVFCGACTEDGGFHYGEICPKCKCQLNWFHGSNVNELGEIQ